MRRGLVSWSKEEVPEAALERRVARLQRAMAEEGLDVLVAYTSSVQPAAVSWLTQFVPYSNDGLLLVFPQGFPALFASFSKRVQGWIREVSRVGEVGLGTKFAHDAVKMLQERGPKSMRLGFIDRDRIPGPVLQPFAEAGWDLLDASESFARVRQPVDETEEKLLQLTASMAHEALDAIPAGASRASQVLSAIDRSARLAGAEEVFPRIAPELQASSSLIRMEGDAPLGACFAVQLSLAYKGVWVRASRCVARGGVPQSWSSAERWFSEALSGLRAARLVPPGAWGKVVHWRIESCLGSDPFSVVAYGDQPGRLPAGSFGVASVELALPDGPWHACRSFILGSESQAIRLLR